MCCNTAITMSALQHDDKSGLCPDTPRDRSDFLSRSNQRNRSKLIQVRCTPEEHDMILKSADAGGLTVAEYIRRIALRRRIVPKPDYELFSELLRLGQLQRELLRESNGMYREEFTEVINLIKDTLNRVGNSSMRTE